MLSNFLPLLTLLLPFTSALPSFPEHEKRQGTVLAGAPISNITVTADNLVQCQQSTISWTGAISPVTLQISTGGLYLPTQSLESHPGLDGTSFGWTVTQKEGTGMYFQVTDAQNNVGYVQNVYVAASGDSSCLAGQSAAMVASSTSAAAPLPSDTTSTVEPIATSTPVSTVTIADPSSAFHPASSSSSAPAAAVTSSTATPIITVTSTLATSSGATTLIMDPSASTSTQSDGTIIVIQTFNGSDLTIASASGTGATVAVATVAVTSVAQAQAQSGTNTASTTGANRTTTATGMTRSQGAGATLDVPVLGGKASVGMIAAGVVGLMGVGLVL